MEIRNIRELAALMKEYGLTALDFSEKDCSVRLERGAAASVRATDTPDVIDAGPETEEPGSGIVVVKSPMVGVYYSAAGIDAKPFVSLGDRVKAGDVLCIIEAMKMMNEIVAEQEGVIAEVCVSNRQVVEFGHPLFRIRPN